MSNFAKKWGMRAWPPPGSDANDIYVQVCEQVYSVRRYLVNFLNN